MATQGFTSSQSNIRELNRTINSWDRYLRLLTSWKWLPRALIIGLTLSVGVAVASRFYPILLAEQVLLVSAGLLVISLALTMLVVWLWPRSTIKKARRFDLLFDLKERLSTAVEIDAGQIAVESTVIATKQLEETLLAANSIRGRDYLPIKTRWLEWLGVIVLGGLLAGAILYPNPQERLIQQQVEIEQAVAEELERLEVLREEIDEAATLTVEEEQQILEVLDEAIETLSQDDVSQEEAVAALESAEQELRDLSEEFAESRQEALEEASEAFSDSPADEVGEALAEGSTLEAAEALDNIDVDSLSAEEQQELAESLEAAAEELAESNPELAESLEEAAEALREGDAAAAEEALGEAAEQLEEQANPNVEEVEEFADELGEGGEQVGEAGRGQRNQEGGQPGEGDGTQPGENGIQQVQPQGGQGQGSGQEFGPNGQPQGSGGSGRGEADGPAQGGPEGEMGTDNGPGDGGLQEFEGIYQPQRIGGEGGPEVDVPGDPGAGAPTGVEGDFAENPDGETTVPYDEVFSDYEGTANEALDTGYVPLGLRDLVRGYFGRLDPEQ